MVKIRLNWRLLGIFAGLSVLIVGLFVGTVPVIAIGGKRAAILFAFDNGGKTWLPGEGPGQHHVFWNAWSMDVHAVPGTAVKPRLKTNDGDITMTVASVSSTCASPNSAGKNVRINVYIDDTYSGQIIYGHLDNVQVATGNSVGTNTILGYLKLWGQSSCWQDTLSDGIVHTHIEIAKGCYNDTLSPWSNYGSSTALGMLSSAYSNENISVCDSQELATVMGPGNAVPIPSINVPVNDQDLTVSVDGTKSKDPDGSITSYKWEFGDGERASGPKTMHQYSGSGEYRVKLTVTDDKGAQTTTSREIFVRVGQMVGDVTGDGKDDAVAYFPSDGDWYVAPSGGSGFVRDTSTWHWLTQFGIGSTRQFLADVNGDGKADALAYFESTGNWYVALSNGSGFVHDPSSWLWLTNFGSGSSQQMIADVTGDGKADAVAHFPDNGNWYVAPSTGSSFTRDSSTWQWLSEFGRGSYRQTLADVDGDNKADAVAYFKSDGDWYVAPSNGSSFVRDPSTWHWLTQFGVGSTRQMLADVTGDGKADAIVYFLANGNWYVAPSGNSEFIRSPSNWLWMEEFGIGASRQLVADATGDGRTDALAYFTPNGDWYGAPSGGSLFVRNPDTWKWLDTFGLGS